MSGSLVTLLKTVSKISSILIVVLASATWERTAVGQTQSLVAVRAVKGAPRIVTADGDCGPTLRLTIYSAERVSRNQIFTLIDLDGGELKYGDQVQLRCNSKYWSVDRSGGVSVKPDKASGTKFTLRSPGGGGGEGRPIGPGGQVLFQAEKGSYLSAPQTGSELRAQSNDSSVPDNVFELLTNPPTARTPAPKPTPPACVPTGEQISVEGAMLDEQDNLLYFNRCDAERCTRLRTLIPASKVVCKAKVRSSTLLGRPIDVYLIVYNP